MKIQEQLPRGIKRHVGDKILGHCVEMLDLMALANATQREERAAHLRQLLVHQRATTALLRACFEMRGLSPALWAKSIELLESIGRQAGGWKNSANRAPAV